MAKQKTIYCCSACGNETANWAGKCPACGAWNTLEEVKLGADSRRKSTSSFKSARNGSPIQRISELDTSAEIRFVTGITEFDRVLGGGAVVGSLNLVGGAPGIGKSTLLLQMCGSLGAGKTVLYVPGEESERQLKLRAMRLGVDGGDTYVLAETDLDNIIAAIDEVSPDIVIIADPEQLRRVVNNIIGNSVKYMNKQQGFIQIRIKDVGDFIQVELEDNGRGIAQKDLPYIFDRFYRTDASRNSATGGSGIGLSIVKKIVEDHGGKIWATSKEDAGTIMYFVIRKYQEVTNE